MKSHAVKNVREAECAMKESSYERLGSKPRLLFQTLDPKLSNGFMNVGGMHEKLG